MNEVLNVTPIRKHDSVQISLKFAPCTFNLASLRFLYDQVWSLTAIVSVGCSLNNIYCDDECVMSPQKDSYQCDEVKNNNNNGMIAIRRSMMRSHSNNA